MIDLIIFCMCTASLSHFFQMTQDEGMIFEWYGKLLDRIPEFFAKPLGSCVLCNGTWIYIIVFFLYWLDPKSAFIPTIVLLFLGMGVNYIFIEMIGKGIEHD
jgi:hypothetical protein